MEQCFGPNRFHLTASMNRLCLLNWQWDAGDMQAKEIDIQKRPDLLPALMKDTGVFYLPKQGMPKNHSLERYQETLQNCQVLELSGGIDFQEATKAIARWFDL